MSASITNLYEPQFLYPYPKIPITIPPIPPLSMDQLCWEWRAIMPNRVFYKL